MSGIPAAPAPLLNARARIDKFEADRATLFALWKKLLESVDGNVSLAGRLEFPDEEKSRDRAAWIVRRLGLTEYAAELRMKVQERSMGRPKTS